MDHENVTTAGRSRKRLSLLCSIVLPLLLIGGPVSAQEAPDPATAADEVLAAINEAADEAGIDPDELLDAEFGIPGPGNAVTGRLRGLVNRLTGGIIEDDEGEEGESGHLNAGNIFHLYTNINIEGFSPSYPAGAELPPEPDLRAYEITESAYVPETPFVPVINPFLLVPLPAELTDAMQDAGVEPPYVGPLVGFHAGGRLVNVKGSDYTLGFHSAGTTALGSNVDTDERETTDDDPWSIWVPLFTGEMLKPDSAIDFTGFAEVIETQTCTPVTVRLPLVGERTIARVCVAIGIILGDGVTQVDGQQVEPLDLPVIWEDAPEEVQPVLSAVDEAAATVNELVDSLPLPDVDVDDPEGTEVNPDTVVEWLTGQLTP